MAQLPGTGCQACCRMQSRSRLLSYQRPRHERARLATACAERPPQGDAWPKPPSWHILAVMGVQLALVQAATASSLAFAGPSQDAQRLLVLDRDRIEQLLADEFRDRLHDLSNEQLVALLDQLLAAKRAAAPDLFSSALAAPAPQQSAGPGFRLFPMEPTLPFLGSSSSSSRSDSTQPHEQGQSTSGGLQQHLGKLPFWPSTTTSSSSNTSSSDIVSDSSSSSSTALDAGLGQPTAQAGSAEDEAETIGASASSTSSRGGHMPWLNPWNMNKGATTDDNPETSIEGSSSSITAGQSVGGQIPGPWWGSSPGGSSGAASSAAETTATSAKSGSSSGDVAQSSAGESSSSSSSSSDDGTQYLTPSTAFQSGTSADSVSSSAPSSGGRDIGGTPPAAASTSSLEQVPLDDDEDAELDLTQSLLWGPSGAGAGAEGGTPAAAATSSSSSIESVTSAVDDGTGSSGSRKIGPFELPASLGDLPRVALPNADGLRAQLEAGQQAVTDRLDQVRQGLAEAWEEAGSGLLPGLAGPLLLVAGAGAGTYALGSLVLSLTAGAEEQPQQEGSSTTSPEAAAAAGGAPRPQDAPAEEQQQPPKPTVGKLAAMLQQEASAEAAASSGPSAGPPSSSSSSGGSAGAAAAAATTNAVASSKGAAAAGSNGDTGGLSAGVRSSSRQREWLLDNADDAEPVVATTMVTSSSSSSSSRDPLAVAARMGSVPVMEPSTADSASASGASSSNSSGNVLWVRDEPPRLAAAAASAGAAGEAGGAILWQAAEAPVAAAAGVQGPTILWEREEAPPASLTGAVQQQQLVTEVGTPTTTSSSSSTGSQRVLWQRPAAGPGDSGPWVPETSSAGAAAGSAAGPVLWQAAGEADTGAPVGYSFGQAEGTLLWRAAGAQPQVPGIHVGPLDGSEPRVGTGGGSNGRRRLSGVLSNAEDAEQGSPWNGSGQEAGSSRARHHHHHHHQQQQQAGQHAVAAGRPAHAKALWPVLIRFMSGSASGGLVVAAAEDPWGTTPLELAPSADHLAALGLLQQPAASASPGSSLDVAPAAAVGQAVLSPW